MPLYDKYNDGVSSGSGAGPLTKDQKAQYEAWARRPFTINMPGLGADQGIKPNKFSSLRTVNGDPIYGQPPPEGEMMLPGTDEFLADFDAFLRRNATAPEERKRLIDAARQERRRQW